MGWNSVGGCLGRQCLICLIFGVHLGICPSHESCGPANLSRERLLLGEAVKGSAPVPGIMSEERKSRRNLTETGKCDIHSPVARRKTKQKNNVKIKRTRWIGFFSSSAPLFSTNWLRQVVGFIHKFPDPISHCGPSDPFGFPAHAVPPQRRQWGCFSCLETWLAPVPTLHP